MTCLIDDDTTCRGHSIYGETCVFGHLGTSLKCPDYQGVLIFLSLDVNGYFGTITKSPDYRGVPIFKGPD